MRTRSFFYTDRQNALIEKAAMSDNAPKRIKTLSKQIGRSYESMMLKVYKIRKAKGMKTSSKTGHIARKEKFVKLAQGTTLNFTNIKKAEMHDNHIRIYF